MVSLAAQPTAASHFSCPQGDDESVMQNWPLACRDFIIDPGVGAMIDRARLLAAEPLWTSSQVRFSKNFLWYSSEEQVTITDPDTRWSSCRPLPGPGGVCAPHQVEANHHADLTTINPPNSVLRAFQRDGNPSEGHPYSPVRLSVFEFGGMWISKVCGNWHDIANRPDPVPLLTGVKFRDADRNGQRDAGEPGLGGWQIRIVRESSAVGQATGEVGLLATRDDGSYRFPLEGHGPGRYRVEEVVQPGWKSYTAASATVDVPFGARDATFRVDFGNAEITTDVLKSSFEVLDQPARMEVGEAASFTLRSVVANDGPAGPLDVDELLAVASQPPDCVIDGLPPRRRLTLEVGESLVIDDQITVTCMRRSDHEFAFTNDLTVATPDVTDIAPANNQAAVTFGIPVFEQTELQLGDVRIVCDQYWSGDPFTCTASARVANLGSAPDTTLRATLTLAGDALCSTSPARQQDSLIVVPAHGSESVAASWVVSCPTPALRTFGVQVDLAVGEPHLEAQPRRATLTWVPTDIKPNSDPNSLNVGRPGVVSVAVLSTAGFDATTQVNRATLKWGPTGTEADVVRCGSPEDANGDGLADLVCKFRLSDAQFEPGDDLGYLTGLLADGATFMSADRVRII